MNLPIALLSTDFDGTLFAEFESPPIPHELLELIDKLQAGGTRWVINTGRDMSSLMEALARGGIDVEPDYLVLVEREIHEHDGSQYVPLDEWNRTCTRQHAELFARVHADLPQLLDWINSRFHARIYEDSYSPLCLIAADNGDMDVIHAYLEDYCRSVPQLSLVRNDVYARFCHAAYNKGTALANLARRLAVPCSQVLAVGDHLNDLPMLSLDCAAMLAAPANAVQEVVDAVRQQGGYVSTRSRGEGVLEAIKYYLAAGKT